MTRADIGSQVKWAVNLVIAYGHFYLPLGFVWAHYKVVKFEGALIKIKRNWI